MTNDNSAIIRVFEMQGVWAGEGDRKRWVEVQHVKSGIGLQVGPEAAVMTPAAARSLARALNRQAKRWEAGQCKT